MTAPLIAVLGGSGRIGRVATRMLAADGGVRLRIGGRNADRVTAAAAGIEPEVEVRPVDIDDASALAEFCRDARIVLNCAGPSYLVMDRVAAAAAVAGADYVDVAGDEPAYEALVASEIGGRDQAAVFSAGVLPGASNLVARWAAGEWFDRVFGLKVHAGGLEGFTPIAAQDMVLSLGGAADGTWYGESLAAWRNGRRVPRVLRPESGIELPFFPGTVSVQPYLISGCERMGTALGLTELDWHMVSGGTRLHAAVTKHRGLPLVRTPALTEAGEEICRAADLDLAGHDPYFRMVFQLTGQRAGRPVGRGVIVHTDDSYRITSATAVITVRALLAGLIKPGAHYVDDVLDPRLFVAELERLGAVDYVHSVDGIPGVVEEGVL